jgi:hypothetical protein
MVHFLNYFGNTVLTKIEEFSLELSCTIIEIVNEEKLVWPSYFQKNYDYHVGCIMDYSFIFFLSTWVV